MSPRQEPVSPSLKKKSEIEIAWALNVTRQLI